MNPPNYINELKRRNLYKVVVAYTNEGLERAEGVDSSSSAQQTRRQARTQNL
jgi:hypothetical protein